jgi:hypothetical protein
MFVAVAALTASPADAQFHDNLAYPWNNAVSAQAATVLNNSIMANVMGYGPKEKRRLLGQSQPTGPRPGTAAQPATLAPARRPGGTTTFRPGRRALLDGFAGPQKAQVAQMLGACEKLYATSMSKFGAIRTASDANDLSTSTAFYMAMANYVYWNGQPGAPGDAQPAHLQNLRSQLRARYVASGALVGRSDVEKQAAQDSLVLAACTPMLQLTQANKTRNEMARQAARRSAATLLSNVGLSPNSLRFNPDGSVVIAGLD